MKSLLKKLIKNTKCKKYQNKLEVVIYEIYEKISPRRELNSRPLVYKTSALTTELRRLVEEEGNNKAYKIIIRKQLFCNDQDHFLLTMFLKF